MHELEKKQTPDYVLEYDSPCYQECCLVLAVLIGLLF